MTTIAELESTLKQAAKDPKKFFGDDVPEMLRFMRMQSHPDKFSNDVDKERAGAIFREFGLLADKLALPPVTITTKKRTYVLTDICGVGDVADVYNATSAGVEYLVKVSRVAAGVPLMQHEAEVFEVMQDKFQKPYPGYFPVFVETMRAKDKIQKQVTVFLKPDRPCFTLAQVKAKYTDGVHGTHLAWMYKRLLEGLGALHSIGWVHGAVLPENVVIFPKSHGVNILDLKTASQFGLVKTISARYRDWYPEEVLKKQKTSPATDIHLATKCVMYLAGVDDVPRQMDGYFRAATMTRQSMRPQDAWGYCEEFSEMLRSVYGAPKFHEFAMS